MCTPTSLRSCPTGECSAALRRLGRQLSHGQRQPSMVGSVGGHPDVSQPGLEDPDRTGSARWHLLISPHLGHSGDANRSDDESISISISFNLFSSFAQQSSKPLWQGRSHPKTRVCATHSPATTAVRAAVRRDDSSGSARRIRPPACDRARPTNRRRRRSGHLTSPPGHRRGGSS